MIQFILTAVVGFALGLLIGSFLVKKNILKDENGNLIPDILEDKLKDVHTKLDELLSKGKTAKKTTKK